jgi:hypothetical protein
VDNSILSTSLSFKGSENGLPHLFYPKRYPMLAIATLAGAELMLRRNRFADLIGG